MSYVGPAFVFTTRDKNTGSTVDQDTFGVYRTDWTPEPAVQAIQSVVAGRAV